MSQAEDTLAATASQDPPPPSEKLNTRAAGIVGLAVLCSRVLGLARDTIFYALFGGLALMDAFTTAFRIPNLLRDLFAEGALSTAFVTTFSRTATVQGDAAAWKLANKVATLALLVLGVLTVLGIVFAPWIVWALAPGFLKNPDKFALTITLTQVMYPFILLVSLAALVMGMLNAKNVFGMPAMASSFFNLGSIVSGVVIAWLLEPHLAQVHLALGSFLDLGQVWLPSFHFGGRALVGMAVGTVLGGALQLFVQLPSLSRLGYRFRPDFAWNDPGVRAVLRLMGPAVVATSTTQINVMVNQIFASELGDGRIAWLQAAFRLMQMPLGLFGVALGTVSLPLLARLAAAGNRDGFRSELSRSMRLAFLMTLPSTVGLIMLAEPIMSVIYQHGRTDAAQTAGMAAALQFYALGLSGYAALKILVNAFYALDHRRTPMVVSFIAVGLNLLLNWVFTVHLQWGHRGLAFSTACIASSNFLILYALMHRYLGSLESRAMAALLGKTAVATAVLAGICWAGSHWLLAGWAVQPFWPKLGGLVLVIAAAMAGFAGCAFVLRVPELEALTGALQRRLQRSRR
jgi:putative peptidoglycan lipid II flippase